MQSKQEMKEFVISLLKKHLSEFYYYHNYKHTLYVMDVAAEISREEGCTEAEMELIATAALWHDTGYTKTYKNHEEESCNLASQYLPEYGFSEEDINKICALIMATKIPQSPKNKLEEILADADLEYLGTESFDNTAEDLYRELKYVNPALTEEKWNHVQIAFLKKHQYFTRFCKENKEPVKQDYLNKLISGIQ
jgi:putative nucleotidyltransferase with HDIG domain